MAELLTIINCYSFWSSQLLIKAISSSTVLRSSLRRPLEQCHATTALQSKAVYIKPVPVMIYMHFMNPRSNVLDREFTIVYPVFTQFKMCEGMCCLVCGHMCRHRPLTNWWPAAGRPSWDKMNIVEDMRKRWVGWLASSGGSDTRDEYLSVLGSAPCSCWVYAVGPLC